MSPPSGDKYLKRVVAWFPFVDKERNTTKETHVLEGRMRLVKEPVRAATIRDEYTDGRSKKMQARARKHPMETRGFRKVKEIPENLLPSPRYAPGCSAHINRLFRNFPLWVLLVLLPLARTLGRP